MTAAPEPVEPLLEVRDLRKRYARDGGSVVAVDGVSFSAEEGETLALIGESGCGKSTVGKLVLALLRPDDGEVRFRGSRVDALGRADMREYRRSAQMVFQDPLASFNPRLTIGASLRDAMRLLELDRGARTELAAELLRRVHLPADFLDRHPADVSGGQLQRAGIARALATSPSLIFLDEPTSALDVSIRGQILELLAELQPQTRSTYVLVSHDMRVVRSMATQIVVMYLGQVVEQGPAARVLARPLHPYTRALIGASSRGHGDPRRRVRLSGEALRPQEGDTGCRLRARCPFRLPPCDDAQALTPFEPSHAARCWRAEEIEAQVGSGADEHDQEADAG